MFTKGQSGNPAGRPKGSTNKTSEKLRETLAAFLDEKFEDVKTSFDALKPSQKVRYYVEFLQFAVPKLSAVSVDEYSSLTDEQLDEIIDRLKQSEETDELEN